MKQLDAILALCAAISGKENDYYNDATCALADIVAAWDDVCKESDVTIGDGYVRDFTADLAAAKTAMYADGVIYLNRSPYTAEDYAAATAAVKGTPVTAEIDTAAAVIAAAWSHNYNDNACIFIAYALRGYLVSVAVNAELYFEDDTQTD